MNANAPTSAVVADATEIKPIAGGMRRYLLALAGTFAVGMMLFIGAMGCLPYDRGVSHDFFSEIPLPGDGHWYRDFAGRHIPQIQDQDVFYSNVGHCIAAAKASDIIFLGPSFVNFAINRQALRSSPLLSRLKIYNMAFVGIRGGEFSRRIIKRWDIRVPLWVINVDDQFVHFFSDDLNVTLGPKKIPISAVRRSRIKGYLTVVGRDLRWRAEDFAAARQAGRFLPSGRFGMYRNVSNGDMMLDADPAYDASDNSLLHLARSPHCHTNPAVVDYGRKFLREIGGNAVLMLVPHSQACVQQAAELAKALNVEFIPPPPYDGLTTVDGGGHLDKRGAEKFTSYLAARLVKTKAFRRAFAGRLGLSQ